MVGVRIPLLIVVVGDDHLRLGAPNDVDQPAGRLVEIGLVEAIGMLVGLGIRHARIAVAQHHDLVEPDHRRRLGELGGPHRGDQSLLLLGAESVERPARLAEQRILEIALLATGTAHQDRADPFGVVFGQRGSTLRGFVVGVSMHREDRAGFGRHPPNVIRPAAPSTRDVMTTLELDAASTLTDPDRTIEPPDRTPPDRTRRAEAPGSGVVRGDGVDAAAACMLHRSRTHTQASRLPAARDSRTRDDTRTRTDRPRTDAGDRHLARRRPRSPFVTHAKAMMSRRR